MLKVWGAEGFAIEFIVKLILLEQDFLNVV